MTHRITSQDGGKIPQSRPAPDFSKFMVHDSFCNSITHSSPAGGGEEERRRISRQRLEEISASLSDRDKAVISSIQRFRYLMSGQVQRLHFTDAASPSAALRAANRCLKRLRELGVIDHLSRRIGGVRAGSGALVWYITHAGERLLYLHDRTLTPTKRFFEPSPYFLAHTLAVADVAVTLTELCRERRGMSLTTLQTEPECWRIYSEFGSITALKPDLFASTMSGQYEDRWFIEVDLDTESPSKIVAKCEKYHKYYRAGLEQKEAEVFPLTVWIVPTADRKERLINCIREAFDKQPRLFGVITKDELPHLIRHGGDEKTLC
jgi:hypothetical protein